MDKNTTKHIPNKKILPIFAIFISVLALSTSWLQVSDSRAHNKLSLKPIVQVVHNNILNPDENNEGIFHIHNDGVGPAILTKVEMFIGNELIDKPEVQAWIEIFERLKIGSSVICLQIGVLTGSSLPPSEDHFILRIKDPNIIPNLIKTCDNWIIRQQLNKLLVDVKMRVTYESVYEQQFVAESRSAITSM